MRVGLWLGVAKLAASCVATVGAAAVFAAGGGWWALVVGVSGAWATLAAWLIGLYLVGGERS